MTDQAHDRYEAVLNKLVQAREAVFLKHPHAAGETYFEHLTFALKIALYLLVTTGAAVMHGFFPAILQSTTSRRVRALNKDIEERLGRAAGQDASPQDKA